jgi:hypothetical protein
MLIKDCYGCGDKIQAEEDKRVKEYCDNCLSKQNDSNLTEIEKSSADKSPLVIVCFDDELFDEYVYGPPED